MDSSETSDTRDLDEVFPGIWVGGQRASEDKERLQSLNIKHVLNTATQLPKCFEGDFNYLKLDLLDAAHERLGPHIPTAIAFIKAAVDAEEPILVHCMAGQSRSVSMVLAYMIQEHHFALNDALAEIKKSRP